MEIDGKRRRLIPDTHVYWNAPTTYKDFSNFRRLAEYRWTKCSWHVNSSWNVQSSEKDHRTLATVLCLCDAGMCSTLSRALRRRPICGHVVQSACQVNTLGPKCCTPSEIIVDCQWHFPMNFQVAFSDGISVFSGISQRIETFDLSSGFTPELSNGFSNCQRHFPMELHFCDFWRVTVCPDKHSRTGGLFWPRCDHSPLRLANFLTEILLSKMLEVDLPHELRY